MGWYEKAEICKNCVWYNEEDNGFCEYWAKFKEEDDSCYKYEESKERGI